MKNHQIRVRVAPVAGVLATALSLCWTVSMAAQEPTANRIEHADKEPQNWLTFFGNYQAWSYSPLDQITRENVKQLVPVWAFPTGGQNGLQAAPLVVDGVLYIENHQNHVFAVDAATGRSLWSYAYESSRPTSSVSALGTRGLALGYGLVYMGRKTITLWQSTRRAVRKYGTCKYRTRIRAVG